MWNELNDKEARQVLERGRFAHLGCVLDDGKPYVIPVNYLLRDDSVYIHSREGMKLRALRSNPDACVQVEEIHSPYRWKSAIAFGTFEEIRDTDVRTEILEELLAHFETLTPVEGIEAERAAPEELVVFRVRIGELTGAAEH